MNNLEPVHLAPNGVGYLDMREYNKARWAYEQSHPGSPFMRWLRMAGKGPQRSSICEAVRDRPSAGVLRQKPSDAAPPRRRSESKPCAAHDRGS